MKGGFGQHSLPPPSPPQLSATIIFKIIIIIITIIIIIIFLSLEGNIYFIVACGLFSS